MPRVGGQVYWALQSFCKAHLAGWAFPPEAAFRCFSDDPGRVRKPDASFIALERLTRSECEEDAFLEVVPDLVVEVISPNDKAEEVELKIEDWLQAVVKVL